MSHLYPVLTKSGKLYDLRKSEENLQSSLFDHVDSVPAKLMEISSVTWSR